jgi:hypothetical protein
MADEVDEQDRSAHDDAAGAMEPIIEIAVNGTRSRN